MWPESCTYSLLSWSFGPCSVVFDQKVTHSTHYTALNQGAQAGSYSLFSISTRQFLLPYDFDTAYFLFFFEKELYEPASSLRPLLRYIDASLKISSIGSSTSATHSSPNLVVACCSSREMQGV